MDTFFDEIAVFCGDNEFYDIDGDGHLDDLEGSFMLADVDDELAEIDRDSGSCGPYHTAGSSHVHSYTPAKTPPDTKEINSWIVLIWGIIIPILMGFGALSNLF